ncbi:hypothetical protein pb186bvf_001652 [Paramecium bursaria]
MNLESTQKRKKWTQEEDSLMKEAISLYGHNWIQVSNHLGSRTASQCSQRWKRIKESDNKFQKVNWTKSDEKKLIKLVKEYGRDWFTIAEMFGDRNSRQIREKYINNLNPSLKTLLWSQEEDDLLFELFLKHGSKWASFTKKLPNRSERMIKNRFYKKLRYSHLGLPNAYQEINFKENPYNQIHQQRQIIIRQQNDSQEQYNQEQDCIYIIIAILVTMIFDINQFFFSKTQPFFFQYLLGDIQISRHPDNFIISQLELKGFKKDKTINLNNKESQDYG